MRNNGRKLSAIPGSQRAFGLLLGTLLLASSAWTVSAGEPASSTGGQQGNLKRVTVPVEGICSAGLADIREGLSGAAGISKVEAALTGDGVQVTYEPEKVSPNRIAKMIAELGYGAGPPTTAR